MTVFNEKEGDIFKLLSEAISDGVIIVNTKQEIVASNGAANDMFGYDEEELVGKPLQTLIPREYHGNHGKHFEGYRKQPGKRQMGRGRDLYGAKKNGSSFPVEVGLNPIIVGENSYVMALVIDITERKKTEQELKQWAKIFNESLNEIFIFDAETLKFVNVNYGAQKNTGHSLDQLRQISPVDIMSDFNEKEFRELIHPLIENKQEKLEFETRHQRKDGSTYPVEVHLEMSIEEGRAMMVAIILDITERKEYTENLENTVEKRTAQLEEALLKEKELNELKTKFLSLVSHEFKTPLTGILSSANLLEKYTLTEQQNKREKHVNTIKSKVKYLDNILTDFLSVERLESGKVNYKFSDFPLSKVINEVVYDANMMLKDGQKINYPKNIDSINLNFDEKILELILTNLIGNAVKYSSENSIIDIDVVEGEYLEIIIKDQGIGIPQNEQKHIFNRYFRAGNALVSQGTGIGLNIVKSHLENLGGSITFISKENKGSTFRMSIPLVNN